jgi:hypothetical protein
MRTRVETCLGDLTVYTDRKDWEVVVAMLVDVAEELSVPLPNALYYGPADYTRLLSSEDFSDRHLTRRPVASPFEYWHRDRMVLLFGSLGDQPMGKVRAMLAHELLHHSDNLEGLNITSYALPCIYGCIEDFSPACVNFFKVCMDAFRNASVNSRLPSIYREICVDDVLEQALKAMVDSEQALDDIQRGLALLYTTILASSIVSFIKKEREAMDILNKVRQDYPYFKQLSLFLQDAVRGIIESKLSIDGEESYIRSFVPLLCSNIKEIFHL